MADWAREHPAAAVGIAAGATMILGPALISAPLLSGLGFGASGVAGGSVAAGAQAAIGNVMAGSLFATLQSAGAAGPGLALVNGVVQGVGVLAAAAGAGAAVVQRNGNGDSEGGNPGDGDNENGELGEPNEDKKGGEDGDEIKN